MVQKLYTLFDLAKVHEAKAQIAEVVGIIRGPGGELVMVDACLVLSPRPRPPLLASLCDARQAAACPVVSRASAELPDLMPLIICHTLQVIRTASHNHLNWL